MVAVKQDLTGYKFGKLTVISQTEDHICPNGRHYPQWLCECECAEHTQIVVIDADLKRGHTKSCGCLRSEKTKEENKIKKKKINQYTIRDNVVVGLTFNTQKEFYVDAKNFDKIKDICWCEIVQRGMSRLIGRDTATGKNIFMHQLLGFVNYDHIDRNELNNLENNLRPATASENSQNRKRNSNNTSGIIGVGWRKDLQQWVARIKVKGRSIYLGSFIDKDDAIVARLKAEQKYFKEFAPQIHLYAIYGIEEDNNDEI